MITCTRSAARPTSIVVMVPWAVVMLEAEERIFSGALVMYVLSRQKRLGLLPVVAGVEVLEPRQSKQIIRRQTRLWLRPVIAGVEVTGRPPLNPT